MFERLSVFRGSFTRDAAASIAEADLRLLFDLSVKSLVRRLDLGRYELHELLRHYAADRLALDSEGSEAALERHARFYVGLLESRRSTLLGPRMVEARAELRSEVDNLRTAVEWAAIHWDDDEARAAFDSLYDFYWMHSWFEGAEIFERISGLLEGSTGAKRVSNQRFPSGPAVIPSGKLFGTGNSVILPPLLQQLDLLDVDVSPCGLRNRSCR